MSIYAQRRFDLGFGVTVMKHDLTTRKTLPSIACEYDTGEPIEFSVKREDDVLGIYVPNNVKPLITLEGKGAWSGFDIEDYKVDCVVTRDDRAELCDLNFSVSLKTSKLILIHFTLPYEDNNVYNWFFGDAKTALPKEQEPEPDCEKLLVSNPTWFINDEGVSTKVGSCTLVIKPGKNSRRHVSRVVYDCYDEPTKFSCDKVCYNGEEMFIIKDADDVPIALVPYSNVAAILNNYNN